MSVKVVAAKGRYSFPFLSLHFYCCFMTASFCTTHKMWRGTCLWVSLTHHVENCSASAAGWIIEWHKSPIMELNSFCFTYSDSIKSCIVLLFYLVTVVNFKRQLLFWTVWSLHNKRLHLCPHIWPYVLQPNCSALNHLLPREQQPQEQHQPITWPLTCSSFLLSRVSVKSPPVVYFVAFGCNRMLFRCAILTVLMFHV